MRIAEAFFFGNITQLPPRNDRQIFLAIRGKRKSPGTRRGFAGTKYPSLFTATCFQIYLAPRLSAAYRT